MRDRWLIATGLAGLILALIFAAGQIRVAHDYIQSGYQLDDDTRQHLTPFAVQRQPEAFNDRLVSDYAEVCLPHGYYLVMSLVSRYTDPLTGSKYLGLTLMLAAMLTAILVGGRVGGLAGAAVALALTIRSDAFAYHVYAGLFRSFALPLGLLHLYLLFGRRYALAGFSLALQALFYPPLCIINIPVTLLAFSVGITRNKIWLRRQAMPFGVGLAVALLALVLFGSRGGDYGSPISLSEAELMCEWYRHGRLPELPLSTPAETLNDAWQVGVEPGSRGRLMLPDLFIPEFWRNYAVPAAMLLLFLTGVAWNRYAAGILAAMAVSGFVFYLTARANAFALGYPARYIQYALPFVAFLLWPVAWGAVCKRWGARSPARIAVLMLGAVILFSYPWRLPLLRDLVIDRFPRRDLYQALKLTGPDTLITAWTPEVLDDIPLLAGREVFVNVENAHPVYMPYYREVRERMLDTVELAFATNVSKAVAIRDRRGLTHLIMERRLENTDDRMPWVFSPLFYTGAIMWRRAPLENMIFSRPPDDWLFYQDDEFVVFDLRRLPASDSLPADSGGENLSAGWISYPDDLELVEMRVIPESIRPDGVFVMEYTWRAPIYLVYRPILVFVHFLRDGELIFTADHPLFVSLDHEQVNWRADAPVTLTYLHEHRAPSSEEVIDDVMIGLINRRTGKRIMPVAPNEHINGAVSVPLRY